MKIKVSDATPLQLDWLVAKCEGFEPELEGGYHEDVGRVVIYRLHAPTAPGRYRVDGTWSPSTDYALGGPVLAYARISRTIDHSGLWVAYWTDRYTDGDKGKLHMQCDRSELVAGLRCYVALNLGDEVEIPEELI